jgi:hypothetical protein
MVKLTFKNLIIIIIALFIFILAIIGIIPFKEFIEGPNRNEHLMQMIVIAQSQYIKRLTDVGDLKKTGAIYDVSVLSDNSLLDTSNFSRKELAVFVLGYLIEPINTEQTTVYQFVINTDYDAVSAIKAKKLIKILNTMPIHKKIAELEKTSQNIHDDEFICISSKKIMMLGHQNSLTNKHIEQQ